MIGGIEWAAGLFEGEGCFTINRRKSGAVQLVAVIASTDLDVLQHFQKVVGFGNIYRVSKQRLEQKQQWHWHAERVDEVEALFALFEPYLGQRRRERAQALITERRTFVGERFAPRRCEGCDTEFAPIPGRGRRAYQRYCTRLCRERSNRRLKVTA